jgi:hypothetical protein
MVLALPNYIAHKVDEYTGDLIYLNLAGSTALLETKSANLSDRPSLHFICDLVKLSKLQLFLNYGPTLVGYRRRMLQSVGSKRSIETLESTIRSAILRCLKGLSDAPQKLEKHLRM